MGRKSSSRDRWDFARILALLGALVALVGYIIGMVSITEDFVDAIVTILMQLIGVIISILILFQVKIITSRKIDIPFNWIVLFVFVCLQAVLFAVGRLDPVAISGLGVFMEAVAVVLLLINEMS